MVSYLLEKLIHEGVARYNTHVIGSSGVGRIKVREKSFLVITDFTFYHFSDTGQGGVADPDEWLRRSVHQLDFSSEKYRNHYVIRGDVNTIMVPGSDNYSLGHSKYDTYLLHTSDVHINIITMPGADTWATNYSAVPGESQEFPPPLGYSGLLAVRENDLGTPGVQYLPLGVPGSAPLVATGGYRDQFRADVIAQNVLQDPSGASAKLTGTYPIVNIGYVQVNKEAGKIAQGTI